MINENDGARLEDALLHEESHENRDALKGLFVPMKCIQEKSQTNPNLKHSCEPIREDHRQIVSRLSREKEGSVHVNEGNGNEMIAMSYKQAEFGNRIKNGQKWIILRQEEVLDFCGDADYSLDGVDYKEKAVIVRRGGCDFITKAKILSDLGAGLMILANHNETTFPMGANTTYFGSKVRMASIMISNSSSIELNKRINHDEAVSIVLERPMTIFGYDNEQMESESSTIE